MTVSQRIIATLVIGASRLRGSGEDSRKYENSVRNETEEKEAAELTVVDKCASDEPKGPGVRRIVGRRSVRPLVAVDLENVDGKGNRDENDEHCGSKEPGNHEKHDQGVLESGHCHENHS